MSKNKKRYLLVGSPNAGKSTYYNKITWKMSPTGNVDRVTTTANIAKLRWDRSIEVIDLPGIISLGSYSEDELVAFDYIFNKEYDGVVNIISASSLERDLLLTIDLAESGVLSLINVNMIDELKGIKINDIWLTSKFKVLVNQMSAKNGTNIKNSLLPIYTHQINQNQTFKLNYSDHIEQIISLLEPIIPEHHLTKRSIIIQALFGNKIVLNWLRENHIFNKFQSILKASKFNDQDILSIQITKRNFINNLIKKIYKDEQNKEVTKDFIHKNKFAIFLDKIFLNRYFAIPLFLILIIGIWFLTFYEYTGGWIQAKLADDGFGKLQEIIDNSITNIDATSSTQSWWAGFVSNGIFGGIFTVLSFIPWILILSFLISILEQVGIISRVGIVFDRWFKRSGLSGRSIINMIVGVGCNIPSILMAKNANSWKEKVTTIMIMPFISCSARVVVYGYLSQLFVSGDLAWLFNLSFTLFSMIIALFFGYFFSNFLFRNSQTIFLTELPKYRSPDFYVAFKKVILECFDFIKRVLIIVSVCNLIIWILSYTSPHTIFIDVNDQAGLETSFLRYLSIPFQFILYPLGIGESWQLTIALVTAFPAKEIAASNIELLIDINAVSFMYKFSTMISFICLFSFYVPCLATISVMFKEIGKKYSWINIGIGLAGAWIISFIIFNLSGLIESMHQCGLANSNILILLLIVICFIIYGLNYCLKQWYIAKTNNLSKNIFIANKACLYTNTAFLASLFIASNVLLLQK